jgi:hypothetical protein
MKGSTFNLPCLPTLPDVNVTLWRESMGSKQILPDKYVSYSPKVSLSVCLRYLSLSLNLSSCLSVSLFLFIYLSVFLSIFIHVYQSLGLSSFGCARNRFDRINTFPIVQRCVCLFVCLSLYLSFCLSLYLFSCISVSLSVTFWRRSYTPKVRSMFDCLSLCLSFFMSICLSICHVVGGWDRSRSCRTNTSSIAQR